MTQGSRIAAVLLVSIVLAIVSAATAPALSLPTTTTTVTTPTVATPTVSTPIVTTPTVTVPKTTTTVTTPKVSTPPAPKPAPTVTTPKATVPSVSTPTVSTPKGSTPKVSTPKVTVPSTTVGGSGSGSGGGSSGTSDGGGIVTPVVKGVTGTLQGGSTGGLVAGPGGTATSVAGTTTGGYTTPNSGNATIAPFLGGGTTGGPGGFAGGFGPGGPAGGGPGSGALFALGIPRASSGAFGTGGVSALAAAVASLAGCFYALTPFEQQVLIVRTGIDGRQPLSRTQLASLLGTTPQSLARTEQHALGTLSGAAQTSGCMPIPVLASGTLTAFIGGPFGPLGTVTPALAPASRLSSGSGGAAPRYASTSFAERLSGLGGGGQAGPLWAALVIALLLASALAALGREVRRSVT